PPTRYEPEEKQWLKDNFGGEFHLLPNYRLSIYDEDERDEGRDIVRGMMKYD
ncbi:hypothetical protein QBC38DRAFT_338319, partial [Podospora fimiseda]